MKRIWIVLVVVVVGFFAWLVWPTPYVYMVGSSGRLYCISRLTNQVWVSFNASPWYTIKDRPKPESKAAAPKDIFDEVAAGKK